MAKKKLVVTDKTACMACLACAQACSEAFYKVSVPAKSCIQIVVGKDGEPVPKTCIQCGKCARTCKQGAISQNAKGVFVIDKKLCNGCGECVAVCPMQVMVKVPENDFTTKCIACGICTKACPMGILEIQTKEE